MINLSLAFRSIGGLSLALISLVGFVIAITNMRKVQRRMNVTPSQHRQLFGYKIGSYVCVILFLVSLSTWVSLLLAVRFNWNRDDVSEIEILQFSAPYPQVSAEQTISINDERTLSSLFDGLKLLQPYESGGHELSVGKSYILRLRRRSDGQWSRYRVKIHPDSEPTSGGAHMTGVYELSLDVGSGRFNLGRYQAPQLGRLVEQIASGNINGTALNK